VSSEITVAVTHTGLAWSFALVSGVVAAAAAIGWGVAAIVGTLNAHDGAVRS
jgi:hypothetical protein